MGSLALQLAWERWLVEPLAAAVFPSACVVCRQSLTRPTRGPLCGACLAALPRHAVPICLCGQPLVGGQLLCARCRRGRNPLTAGTSLGPYEGSLRDALQALKYRGRRRVAAQLAEALWQQSPAQRLFLDDPLLVPVPLHGPRWRERGYNQAELLARAFGRLSGAVCAARVLVRTRSTVSQTNLTAAARRVNMAGAFGVRRGRLVSGRVVVLVDDVYTTGATARECARMLRRAGAREVRVVTIARTA